MLRRRRPTGPEWLWWALVSVVATALVVAVLAGCTYHLPAEETGPRCVWLAAVNVTATAAPDSIRLAYRLGPCPSDSGLHVWRASRMRGCDVLILPGAPGDSVPQVVGRCRVKEQSKAPAGES